MARTNNPTLGIIQCDCGKPADVKQTKRGKGRYLYSHCPDCGLDQRTGKRIQTRLWHKTVWRSGCEPANPPANVDLEVAEEPKAPVVAKPAAVKAEPESEPESEPDFDPDSVESEPEKVRESNNGFMKAFLVCTGILAMAGAAIRGL